MRWEAIPTPCYVVDEAKLRENLEILHALEEETGAHVLNELKAKEASKIPKDKSRDLATVL